jgi:poly-gamma-glutamate synthesis protein (capsule biosynthesis protein)
MLYEAEAGDVQMAFTGESMISRELKVFREARFLKIRDLLHSADVRFANAEILFHNFEDSPAYRAGTYMRCDPRFIEDLQWFGINIVGCANNHAYDYGENGVLTNIRYLDQYGMPHAGTGRHLAEASSPVYMDTPKGRVALISATTLTANATAVRAGEQFRDLKGRPGANTIGSTTEWVVDRESFDALRRLSSEMGWAEQVRRTSESGYGAAISDSDTLVHLMDQNAPEATAPRYVVGEEFGRRTYINQADLERNLQRVSDAKRMADWVLFTVHNHEGGKTLAEPSDHIKVLAHAVIDAGADAFIGHGPHEDRGIEIYNGRPIFYSLGDFIGQNDTVLLQPFDNMARQSLSWEGTPADFYDARSANGTRGQVVEPIRWQSVVATVNFTGGQLSEIKLHPVDLGYGQPRSQQGRPMMAEGDVAQEILERFQRLSEPFGTAIRIDDGVGTLQLS